MVTKNVAVINGAYGGMGSAIARRLLQNGYALALLGRNHEKLKSLKNELQQITAEETEIRIYEVDVRDSDYMKNVANNILNDFDKINVLVNALGIVHVGSLLEVTEAQWLETIQTSLMGAVRFVTNFVPKMIANKLGTIILVNGTFSIQPDANFVINSTLTGAINNFAKAISKDLGKYNIRVNTLNPGATQTPLWDKVVSDISIKYNLNAANVMEQIVTANPLGRIANVNDIANAVEFLCSEKSIFINGSFITIDGGATSAF